MGRVVPDYTQGEWSETTDGVRCVRTFSVHDLGGSSSSVIKRAVEDPAVPSLEDPHPNNSNIVVVDKTGSPMHDNSVLVRVTYEVPTWQNAPGVVSQEISLDTTLIERKTFVDINDVRIQVSYDTPGVGISTQYPSVDQSVVVVTATINKSEVTTEADLLLRAVQYVGTVNNAVWNNWPAKTWLLEDLQSRPSNRSGRRDVSYVLSYRPETWQYLAYFLEAGRAPPDATEGDGFARFDIRELRDFSALPVNVPTMP